MYNTYVYIYIYIYIGVGGGLCGPHDPREVTRPRFRSGFPAREPNKEAN